MRFFLFLALAGNCLAAYNFTPPPRPYTPPPMYFNPNPSGPTLDLDGYLKSGEKISFKSRIYRMKDSASFVRLDDARFTGKSDSLKRVPADFDSLIARTIDHTHHDTAWHKAEVFANDWMFGQIKGRISIFSGAPAAETDLYMKIGDSAITGYDKAALRSELLKNPESRRLLERQFLGYALNTTMVIAGVVMIVSGLAAGGEEDDQDDPYATPKKPKTSPLVGIGAGTLLASWIPYLLVSNNFDKAIAAYNK